MRGERAVALVLALAGASTCQKTQQEPSAPSRPTEERGKSLAHELVIYDGHVDLPYRLEMLEKEGKPMPDLSIRGSEGEFDAVLAREGGLDAPFMSIYIPAELQKTGGAKALADKLIDRVDAIVDRWPSRFALAGNVAEVHANHKEGLISLLKGIENGAALEGDLANVQHFFDRGVRYITLTHSEDNDICDSSYAETRTWKGLSPFGARVVAEMNRVGIMVDISHVSDDAFWQVMEVSSKPVIASHSSLRHFVPGFERDMSDEMITRLAQGGGVVMINFGSGFISQAASEWYQQRKDARMSYEREHADAESEAVEKFVEAWTQEHPFPFADVRDVADHIDRVVQLVGVEHVGFGSDFDGVGDTLPTNLKDASHYPRLIDELLRRGYKEEEIALIASKNLERVWLAQNNSLANPPAAK